MKKLIVLLLITFCGLHMFAQTDSSTRITPIKTATGINVFQAKDYRFTISLNPLVSWFSPDSKNIESGGARVGFGGSINLEKNLTSNVAFTVGLGITQMGGKLKYDSLDVNDAAKAPITVNNVSYTFKTRYVDIPLMMKFRTDEFGYNRVFFEVGTSLSFLWRVRADVSQNIFTDKEGGNKDRDVNENRNDFEGSRSSVQDDNILFMRVPLTVGAGWEYALSNNTVVFGGLRYSAGLFNIMRADDTKAFNNYIGLNIGLLF